MLRRFQPHAGLRPFLGPAPACLSATLVPRAAGWHGRFFAVVLPVVGFAGCASILGVDSDDYIDAADVLCKCASQQDACKGEVEGVIEESPAVEQLALDCLSESDGACKATYACVARDYCSNVSGRCFRDDNDDAVVTCCEGLLCQGTRCVAPEGAACPGRGKLGGCALGLKCVAGVCVAE